MRSIFPDGQKDDSRTPINQPGAKSSVDVGSTITDVRNALAHLEEGGEAIESRCKAVVSKLRVDLANARLPVAADNNSARAERMMLEETITALTTGSTAEKANALKQFMKKVVAVYAGYEAPARNQSLQEVVPVSYMAGIPRGKTHYQRNRIIGLAALIDEKLMPEGVKRDEFVGLVCHTMRIFQNANEHDYEPEYESAFRLKITGDTFNEQLAIRLLPLFIAYGIMPATVTVDDLLARLKPVDAEIKKLAPPKRTYR